ncbi:MAG TPA: VWA domain-containing protein [Planctomycetota bacterium]|nr:VWA domain-containing protein [Planctomycetota bacterium]
MSALLFLVPRWWPALLVLPVLLWLGARASIALADRRRRAFGRRDEALAGRTCGGRLRLGCALAAAGLATAALLQPVAGETAGEPVGPDVVLCLDVSRSMAARDAAPTRLGAAQQQIEHLAAVAAGARLGLVAFAGDARLAVPLCSDLEAVVRLADDLTPGGSGRGGTDLGAAIDAALAALQRVHGLGGSIVLLTDGEDFAGRGRAAAARALAAGVPVHCLGFGGEGGSKVVVEAADGETFLKDVAGDEVVTRLDAASLADVAAAGGGAFERPRSVRRLAELYAAVLAPAAQAAAARDPRQEPAQRFQWPLLGALLFWMLRACLPERRR